MQLKQLFNLLDGTKHSDPYSVLTELECVSASLHKGTVAKWYPLQGSSEHVPLIAEGQELNTPYHSNRNVF